MTLHIDGLYFSLLILLLGSICYFIRKSIISYINGSINHKFEGKLEALQSINRKAEEDIKYFHNLVSASVTTNDTIIKPYQLNAIDNLWLSFLVVKKNYGLAASLANINILELKKSLGDPKIKAFIKTFTNQINIEGLKTPVTEPNKNRIWIGPMAWALYLAYETIINYVLAQFVILDIGEDPDRFIATQKILELIKAVIPDKEIISLQNYLRVIF